MKDSLKIKFICFIKDDQVEETFSYNKILDYLEQQEENVIKQKFKRITAHEGPLKPSIPNYNRLIYNIMIKQENREITLEPLSIIEADDLVTYIIYVRKKIS